MRYFIRTTSTSDDLVQIVLQRAAGFIRGFIQSQRAQYAAGIVKIYRTTGTTDGVVVNYSNQFGNENVSIDVSTDFIFGPNSPFDQYDLILGGYLVVEFSNLFTDFTDIGVEFTMNTTTISIPGTGTIRDGTRDQTYFFALFEPFSWQRIPDYVDRTSSPNPIPPQERFADPLPTAESVLGVDPEGSTYRFELDKYLSLLREGIPYTNYNIFDVRSPIIPFGINDFKLRCTGEAVILNFFSAFLTRKRLRVVSRSWRSGGIVNINDLDARGPDKYLGTPGESASGSGGGFLAEMYPDGFISLYRGGDPTPTYAGFAPLDFGIDLSLGAGVPPIEGVTLTPRNISALSAGRR